MAFMSENDVKYFKSKFRNMTHVPLTDQLMYKKYPARAQMAWYEIKRMYKESQAKTKEIKSLSVDEASRHEWITDEIRMHRKRHIISEANAKKDIEVLKRGSIIVRQAALRKLLKEEDIMFEKELRCINLAPYKDRL